MFSTTVPSVCRPHMCSGDVNSARFLVAVDLVIRNVYPRCENIDLNRGQHSISQAS